MVAKVEFSFLPLLSLFSPAKGVDLGNDYGFKLLHYQCRELLIGLLGISNGMKG